MASQIQLIVGLGNPGSEYEATRHNVGFWFVDAIAAKHGGLFKKDAKFHGAACKVTIQGNDVWLLKPNTFMNRSGQAIASLAAYYKIPVESILVVHDELDLPVGVLKLKKGGGHGGHNGLRSTIGMLGGNAFLRLRLGIGHPGDKNAVTNYVLKRAGREDEQHIKTAIEQALEEVPAIVGGDLEKAMQRLHTRKGSVEG